MNIIIAGCGKIGSTLLRNLVAEGHNVTAIDDNPAVIEELNNIYDVIGVCGNGTDCDTLAEAGVSEAELFVATTDSDEKNMLACFLAKCMKAGHTIARIRNPDYNDESLGFMRQQLGLANSLNPERLTAEELFNILKLPSAVKIETFSQRNFEMVELLLREDSALLGMSLWQLRKKFPARYLIGCVMRGEEVIIPDGNFELKAGDRIGLYAAPHEVQKLLKMLGLLQKQARSVMLLGASKIAYYLTQALLASGNRVTVIDKNPARCAEFAEAMPKATVICGDGASQELLLESGLAHTDAFVALTGMDEENILISIFAESQNVPKVICKANRPEMATLAQKMGLDSLVSPRDTVANILVRYARALENSMGSSVETLYKVMDGKAEALEFFVREDFSHTNIPLKDLKLKDNVLLTGILRSRKAIIPSGDDVLMAGDRVVVMTTGHRFQDLSDILR
ncbi:MAG: Trk system potassium transporter TrkA [Oscillospiraceae bacterium]|nr:Trk system potassium transporter TrkA [Oscillospiraceae bacterium]